MNNIYYRIVYCGKHLQAYNIEKDAFEVGIGNNQTIIRDYDIALAILHEIRKKYSDIASDIYVDSFQKMI